MEAAGASWCCCLAWEGSPKALYLQQIDARLAAAWVILLADEPPEIPQNINSIDPEQLPLYRDICFIPEADGHSRIR